MKKFRMKSNSKKLQRSKSNESIGPSISRAESVRSLNAIISRATSKTSLAPPQRDPGISSPNINVSKKFGKKKHKGEDSTLKFKNSQISDQSDSSFSEPTTLTEPNGKLSEQFITTTLCTAHHEGRELVNMQLPLSAEMIFNLLFSKSKMLVDFHESRNTTDLEMGEWRKQDDLHLRTVSMTVAVSAAVGPKTSKVVEEQVMRACSKPGELYSIDVSITNSGIPYADSFNVGLHFCIVKTDEEQSTLLVYGQIFYAKSVWGLVKNIIEKSAWAGLEDYFDGLSGCLSDEACALGKWDCKNGHIPGRKSEKHPKTEAAESALINAMDFMSTTKNSGIWLFVALLVFFLLIFNLKLMHKISNLEKRLEFNSKLRSRIPNLFYVNEFPATNEEWLSLMHELEMLHATEFKKFHKVLQNSIELLKKTESTLADLIYV